MAVVLQRLVQLTIHVRSSACSRIAPQMNVQEKVIYWGVWMHLHQSHVVLVILSYIKPVAVFKKFCGEYQWHKLRLMTVWHAYGTSPLDDWLQ